MAWKGESRRHSLARKGIKTRTPKTLRSSGNQQVKLFHGTHQENLDKIIKDGHLRTPFIATKDEVMEWEEGIILELEIPREFFDSNCRLDPYLLIEHYVIPLPTEEWYYKKLLPYEKEILDDCIERDLPPEEWWAENPEDARDYMEEKLRREGIDLLEWGKKNVESFECKKNIPIEFVREIHRIE